MAARGDGVWLADLSFDGNDGAAGCPALGAPVFVVDVPPEVVAEREVIGETDGSYRVWCIPAEVANRHLLG